MVDFSSIWTYVHQGIVWVRDLTTSVPVNNDLMLLGVAVLVALLLRRGRIMDSIIFFTMIVLIFLLLRMG